MLTALESFTDASTLTFVEALPHCEAWVHQGRSTHPSYAINAMGGIIVSASYVRVKFESLATPIPPIQLLHYPDVQTSRHRTGSNYNLGEPRNSERTLVHRLSELMALDSWLSFCGRLPEIYNGRSNLIQIMPGLIQKLMSDFAYEFGNIDRTATEGGWQLMREMADLVLRELDQLLLGEAELLFTLVAVLRAAKMALCVAQGSDTSLLRDILLRDVQVHLV